MKDELLLANVRLAQSEVAEAEDQLANLLRELEPAARAEKTTISIALEAAFGKLRAARHHLGVLETLAGGDEESTEKRS
jgi:outer membrane PBP1 activator LpoA protein